MKQPLKVLMVATHPVQYASPIFQKLARDPRVEIKVAYCSLQGAEAYADPDFGVDVKWDIPLLEGYPWIAMKNRSPRPRVGSFFGLINPEIWSLIRSGEFDAIVVYTGYVYVTFWIALVAAKTAGVPILFGTDAYDLFSRDGKGWKRRVKTFLWPRLFRLADVAIALSSAGVAMMKSLGIPENRIALTPYCVNNEWWLEKAAEADRASTRERWSIPETATVILFSGKLQTWKRPMDLLRAFARMPNDDAYLVFAGDGSLRKDVESEAAALGLKERVRFLGFVNQSALPETYVAADIFVLPSEYEPFGLVVNEAMLCGCCAVVSDRVGAHFDLVREGSTGFTFARGDVDALARILSALIVDRAWIRRIGNAARERMRSWSPEAHIDGTIEALRRAEGFAISHVQRS